MGSKPHTCFLSFAANQDVCETQILNEEGSILSPRYPKDYPEDVVCRWIIQIPSEELEHRQYIKLTFEAFQLEYDSSCYFDKLTVYDGLSENNTMLGTFCGDNIPPPLLSSGAQMVVKLTSDYSMTYKGFNATIEFTNTLG